MGIAFCFSTDFWIFRGSHNIRKETIKMLHLDPIRKAALAHLDTLWRDEYDGGGFAYQRGGYPCVMGTCDAAWIFYALAADDSAAKYGDRAADWLLSKARPDGSYFHDYPPKHSTSYRHSGGHAFWMVRRALTIYGRRADGVPAWLEPLLSSEALAAWFDAADWHVETSNHHNILALIPAMLYSTDPAWKDVFYGKLAAMQDPGGWWSDHADHSINISRTFAFTALFTADDRTPPMPRELLEKVRSSQRPDGHFDKMNAPDYHTMDAAYILWRLGNRIGLPFDEREEALRRVLHAVEAHLAEVPVSAMATHHLAAVLHTLGLLAEAFPDEVQTSVPWRFDWDRAEMF